MNQIIDTTKDEITINVHIPLYVYNQLLEKSEYLSINPEKLAMLGLSNFLWKSSFENIKGELSN